jgi:uncharacterized glyoxalase superfamily protein PhnB
MTIGMWHTLTFKDVDAGIEWLRAIGFTDNAVYRDENDPSVVVHAQMLWPAGGGVMFGTHRPNPEWPTQPGQAAAYLVTDDVDGVFSAAVRAGATPLREPRDEDYGGRGATVTDPEGNLWSFGTYAPA